MPSLVTSRHDHKPLDPICVFTNRTYFFFIIMGIQPTSPMKPIVLHVFLRFNSSSDGYTEFRSRIHIETKISSKPLVYHRMFLFSFFKNKKLHDDAFEEI